MKVGKTNRLSMQPIEVRSLQRRVAVARQIAVSLIVRHHKDDVWLFGVGESRAGKDDENTENDDEVSNDEAFYKRLTV